MAVSSPVELRELSISLASSSPKTCIFRSKQVLRYVEAHACGRIGAVVQVGAIMGKERMAFDLL